MTRVEDSLTICNVLQNVNIESTYKCHFIHVQDKTNYHCFLRFDVRRLVNAKIDWE